uniref:Acyltransferase n=1 Tax=Chaetoceros debilis TaxID=122233 RepID=A0A7S3V690_9STRA|mmetsp:Transcript_12447/g.18706  ORF Transcript_12447/g.18706 Transcript_12447/m.18706 type:complete len:336 (+) Transcript_12447:82-1089(+)|eukprot:CAMPEP_0194114952 /NCGR_PEP_ID=MMETSP0150-20130528/22017_1 /TAXON_ID=122233 /ORGANISM="Chaetoceros debilis, Strain MM31A-1" /LENGTH=335 /DNA_ID=CAMNT_0038805309 /DNA_START=21 /DNA_END=1028 /DNA_ORIENTATION=+
MCLSNSQSENKRLSYPSLGLKLRAFLWWNGTYAVTVALSLLFLFGPFLYPQTLGLFIVLPYFTYTIFLKRDELKQGSPWPIFSKKYPGIIWLNKYLKLEFATPPKKLVDLDNENNAQALFAVSPHGTACDYRISMDGLIDTVVPNMAPNIRVLSASILFRLPVVREFSLWTNCVDARRSVAEGLLDANMSILVIPGGMEEQLLTEHGKEIVYLTKRKGFVKLAMRKGVSIVPVYVFGSSDLFHTSNFLLAARHWIMKNLKCCIPLTSGLFGSACPLPVKTTIVMGDPLTFRPKIGGQPTADELDVAHKAYMTALTNLFNEHKERLGYADRELEII